MTKSNSKKSFLLIVIVIAVGAVLFKNQLMGMISGGAGAPPGAAAMGGQMPPMPVETMVLRKLPMAAEVKAVGTLQADESVILRPEIAGRIETIHFNEGESVKKGQPLITLDQSLYQAELQESLAARDLARKIYERSEALFEKGTGTANARDDNRLKLQAAEASVNLSRARLAKMRLIAPFDGVIGVRAVSVGDYVAPGQDLVGVTKLNPLKVDFRIAETYLNNVRTGQSINLTSASQPGEKFPAEIYAIDPQIDVSTRSVVLRAYVPNPNQVLRPGAFAQITIPLGDQLTALMVPEQSITPTGGSQFVYKVVDGKAVTADIKTGFRDNGMVQVTEGLAEGDMIVVAGQMKIRDGAAVAPMPSQQPIQQQEQQQPAPAASPVEHAPAAEEQSVIDPDMADDDMAQHEAAPIENPPVAKPSAPVKKPVAKKTKPAQHSAPSHTDPIDSAVHGDAAHGNAAQEKAPEKSSAPVVPHDSGTVDHAAPSSPSANAPDLAAPQPDPVKPPPVLFEEDPAPAKN